MSSLDIAWRMEVITSMCQQHHHLKVRLAGPHLFWKTHLCQTPAKAASLICLFHVSVTAYTRVWRRPDKLMSAETSVTSQASARCRHLFHLVPLKIAPWYILNPHARLWDFNLTGVSRLQSHKTNNLTHSRSHGTGSWAVTAVCTSQLCGEQRWNSKRAEPASEGATNFTHVPVNATRVKSRICRITAKPVSNAIYSLNWFWCFCRLTEVTA